MHQLIRIAGPTEPMRLLGQIAGLQFERTSATRLDDERWQVSGYADDDALAEIEARGLTVESVLDAETVARQRAELYAQLTPEPEDAG